MKLPRNKAEFGLFMAIVSIISVNIIAPLITFFETEFSIEMWKNTLSVIPFICVCVVALVIITYKPAGWLTSKIVAEKDSFNSHIIINTLCTVLMMSIVLTVVAAMIANKQISLEPIQMFFYRWPRNFAIAFGVECLIAQPIARFVMLKLHQYQDSKNSNMETAQEYARIDD
jgi:hypothetical protein